MIERTRRIPESGPAEASQDPAPVERNQNSQSQWLDEETACRIGFGSHGTHGVEEFPALAGEKTARGETRDSGWSSGKFIRNRAYNRDFGEDLTE